MNDESFIQLLLASLTHCKLQTLDTVICHVFHKRFWGLMKSAKVLDQVMKFEAGIL